MVIHRGEIYVVDFSGTTGREQAGKRPAVVVSSDLVNQSPLVVTVVPATKADNVTRDYSTNVRVAVAESGLRMDSVFLCFQIRAVDAARLEPRPIGRLSPSAMARIDEALKAVLDL